VVHVYISELTLICESEKVGQEEMSFGLGKDD